jgi:hypothetical protein
VAHQRSGPQIAPRLSSDFGAVTRTVPSGYPGYVRICHPAGERDGRSVTWSRVAQATGGQTSPVMQWHVLVGSPDPFNMRGSLWRGRYPERGNLVPELLGPVCDLLADHTATPEHCFFCLWEGPGWIQGGLAGATVRAVPAGAPIPPAFSLEEVSRPAFSPEELSRPRVQLPDRHYLLLVGSLSAARQIGWRPTAGSFVAQSPNLLAGRPRMVRGQRD